MKSLLEFSVYSRWTFTAYISIVVAGGVNMTILEKLYDGEIIPSETAVPDTEEYQEKLREKKRLAEEIKNALPAEKSDLVNQLTALCLSPPIVKETKPFELPPKNENMRRAYAYLLNRRGIDKEVLNAFAYRQMIYESEKYHNVVFVGYDKDGIPHHASLRGTGSASSYKGNAPNSKPEYSFHWTGTSRYLCLFESPIDMLSFISMHKDNWKNHSYAACCGVADHVMWQMMKDNPNIRYVYLCLDSDEPGQAAAHRIRQKLSEQRIQTEILTPNLKDWNEDRQAAAEALCACGNAPRKSAEFSISESQEENLSCPTLQF